MGGVAQLARSQGHRVTGSDVAFYPPMGEQLDQSGVELCQGYSVDNLSDSIDLVVIGNALSRGNVEVEAVLSRGLAYISGAQWLAEYFLRDKHVLAVAGTHGKTTTSSMLAWILDYAGLEPGFLIGGVVEDFACSARAGQGRYFVVEADEYDTAFFDKRSKFVHYRPNTLVLNNLEFDHADIFNDLDDIKKQFHHLVRTVPGGDALIVFNSDDANLSDVLALGCWTDTQSIGGQADYSLVRVDDGAWGVSFEGRTWRLPEAIRGAHNAMNAIAALSAARHVGVAIEEGVHALVHFSGIKRRLEIKGVVNQITVYDDFAHHPTAISATLKTVKNDVSDLGGRVLAVLELRSNSMRMGAHTPLLPRSLECADAIFLYDSPDLPSDLSVLYQQIDEDKFHVFSQVDALVKKVCSDANPLDQIVVMSNGAFDGVHEKLLIELNKPL